MPTYTLTVLDAVGIQEYVFGSNVLRENIGASELVRRATRLWPFEQVRAGGRTNVKPGPLDGDLGDLDDDLHIEDHDLHAEVIYAGGGNCAVLFAEPADARAFVTRLSRHLVAHAPGLELVVAHVEVDWEGEALADKVKEALGQLAIHKLERRVSAPLLGQGVTVPCQSTGLPAVGTDADEPGLKPANSPPRPLSAEILAKLRIVAEANRRLERLFPAFAVADLDIPHEFDDFGREAGDVSYIAVVHADGNSMGERLEQLQARFRRPGDNRSYVEAQRAFSRAVEAAAREALDSITALLLNRLWRPDQDAVVGQARNDRGEMVDVKTIRLAEGEKHRFYAPFRPLVFGGDDLTFVTDGRLGLGLAAAYLRAFEGAVARQDNEDVQGLQACAGVSVVKTHYPFARAYELAANLCDNAK